MSSIRELFVEHNEIRNRLKRMRVNSSDYQFQHYRLREIDRQIKELTHAIKFASTTTGNYPKT